MELPNTGTETLTLYILEYYLGAKEVTRDTALHMTFFYARDEAHAEAITKDALRRLAIQIGCDVYLYECRASPRGFTVWRTHLPGRMQARGRG